MEPPLKRARLDVDVADAIALPLRDTSGQDYIVLAQRNYCLTNVDGTICKSLQKRQVHAVVELVNLAVGGTRASIDLKWQPKTLSTFSFDGADNLALVSRCLNLPSSEKLKHLPVPPIAHYRASLVAHNGRFDLELNLLWLDGVHAHDKIDLSTRTLSHFADTTAPIIIDDQPVPWNVKEFYDNVHVPDSAITPPLNLPAVQCNLYPFQKRAVHWMLSREGVRALPSGQIQTDPPKNEALPLDFREATDAKGSHFYFSPALCVASSSRSVIVEQYGLVKGGILSEAMGLGKTVEMIALICSHTKDRAPAVSGDTGKLIETGTTLIITPPTILEQWKQELREHAPGLRVCHYRGTRANSKSKDDIVGMLAEQDVVLTTYNVIASEIHFVQEAPDRNLRHRPRRPPPKSPLTKILWWRTVLDEGQMVESGVSNAAIVARLIPRQNAWAVTGTPLKQSHRDLHGLMLFLKHAPWCQSTRMWDYLVFYQRRLFRTLINNIALRHSKELVRNELRIPAQSRQVVVIPFTAIESSHYAQMHHDMQQDVGVDRLGAPLDDQWDPENPITIEKMRNWLARLRQTCLHPEVGGRNRKALGRRGDGPLRTVAQVLEVMIEQNEQNVHTERRAVLLAQLDGARILEHARDTDAAAQVLQTAYLDAIQFVHDCRSDLSGELEKFAAQGRSRAQTPESQMPEGDAQEASLTAARQRLRTALELLHVCIFFIGNTHYQRKERLEAQLTSTTDVVQQDGDQTAVQQESSKQTALTVEKTSMSDDQEQLKSRIDELEKQEADAYEEAKKLRTEMLFEARTKAQKRVKTIRSKKKARDFVKLPRLRYSKDDYGGIESRKVVEKLYHFCEAFNTQAGKLEAVRAQMTDMLCGVLVDEEEGEELTGEEYEDSTKHQDEMYVIMEILRALFADRHDAISGQENLLLKQETKQFLRSAKEGEGPAPELMIRLLAERAEVRIDSGKQGSLRGIVTEIRSLASALEWQESSNLRARAELSLVNDLLKHVQRLNNDQTKSITALEQEMNLYRDVMNARLDYYRALQVISDTVAPIGAEETVGLPADQAWLDRMHKQEQAATARLSTALSKRRYLLNLKKEQEDENEAKICTICQFEFELGTLTVCGHHFCKECIQLWWSTNRNCPVCKRRLHLADFYDVTYKPVIATVEPETAKQEQNQVKLEVPSQSNAIYSTLPKTILQQIQSVDIQGSSYGSKVDTLVRHILFLRKSDAGSKTVIFSQYRDFLDVLSRSLRDNSIIHSKFDDKDGILDFKSNPANECFLLHAKAHSTGLNLVCASHVILCEPLINTAIELQAIARVHRIGQIRETCVWMYLIEDTVEEAIYEISVTRRLAHMDGSSRDNTRENTPGQDRKENAIEAANAKELQTSDLSRLFTAGRAGGEMVDKEDLWSCLFSNMRVQESGQGSSRGLADLELGTATDATTMGASSHFGRFLRAEAAASRQAMVAPTHAHVETPFHDDV